MRYSLETREKGLLCLWSRRNLLFEILYRFLLGDNTLESIYFTYYSLCFHPAALLHACMLNHLLCIHHFLVSDPVSCV